MAASPLVELIFALALEHGHPGGSPYSFEPMPECGIDPKTPTCQVRPFCNDPNPSCRPPHYSAARGAWVRTETPETARRRFARVATALAHTATRLVGCDHNQSDSRRCEPLGWTGDASALALAALTVVLHESGLREDVMFGHPPLGRGPSGEVCLMQIGLGDAPSEAHWLSEEQRAELARRPAEREAFARTLLGDSPDALSRCFEVGMRLLARARHSCEREKSWQFGMFSMYGTGRTCRAPDIAAPRTKTFRLLSSTKPTLAPELIGLLNESSSDEDERS